MVIGLRSVIAIVNAIEDNKIKSQHRSKRGKSPKVSKIGSLEPYLNSINLYLSHILSSLDGIYGNLLLSNQTKSLNGSCLEHGVLMLQN